LSANDTSLAPGADTAATVEAFQEAFIVAGVMMLVGAAAALLINDRDAAVSMRQPAEAAEAVEEPAVVAGGH
jgi:hypothetical protein